MLSAIVPSYRCRYAARTVDDLFGNATGEIEVIVVLDGYEPNPPILPRKNLVVISNSQTVGMRKSINIGARASRGDFIMKCDDHCAFGKGFDEALARGSGPDWISIPSRYSLDPSAWVTKRAPVEYEYMAYPYVYLDRQRYGIGLYAKKWEGVHGNDPINRGYEQYYWLEDHRRHIKIDDISIFHGSCWSMPREHFFRIGGLEEEVFNSLYQEPQELSFKTWLSGGRVVVNKNAWYAHMYKGEPFTGLPNEREFALDVSAMRQTERLGTAIWMNDRWEGASKKMEWLVEKFWPVPGWPPDWRQKKIEWDAEHPVSLAPGYRMRAI